MKKQILFILVACFWLAACGADASPTDMTPPATEVPVSEETAVEEPETEEAQQEEEASDTEEPVSEDVALEETLLDESAEVDTAVSLGELAREYVVVLSEEIGARVAGSPEESAAAQFIAAEFEAFGYEPVLQEFTTDVGVPSANVIAIKGGLSDETIIIGAHYDSVPLVQGADDNATGVAVMLEAASTIQDVETPYTIVFVAFGAEEVGLVGSSHYVSQMKEVEILNTIVMINLDSITAGDNAYVYGDGDAGSEIRDWLLGWANAEGLSLQTQTGLNPDYLAGTTGDWSDHAPFKQAGIPYVYFESTNWLLGAQDGYTQVDLQYGDNGQIWHTEFDNLEYIEESFPGRIEERLNLFVAALIKIATEY